VRMQARASLRSICTVRVASILASQLNDDRVRSLKSAGWNHNDGCIDRCAAVSCVSRITLCNLNLAVGERRLDGPDGAQL
jgi:hypothetical protein